MDNMKLIEKVRTRRSLWDPKDERYPLRDEHKIRWQEIAQEMGFPFLEVKTRWRSLRDTFKRELRKRVKHSDGERFRSKWPYFNLMSFLEETGSSRHPNRMSMKEGFSEDSASECSEFQPYESKRRSTQATKLKRRNVKTRVSPSPPPVEDSWFEEEEMKPDPLELLCRDGDDDYQFLLSLLPYLRETPKTRKMVVRSKLQQVFIDEQCAGEHYSSNLHEYCHNASRSSGPTVGECSTSGYQISAADVVTTKLEEISDGLEEV